MATPVIKHASLTGAAANPAVLVDGPKWDASHTITGLENVDNTSDANKPVSTAQAAADAVVAANAANATNLTSGTVPAAQMPALTGDVTTSLGTIETTIAANAVTNAKMATMADNTIKGNVSGGTAVPSDLTATQATAVLNAVVGDAGTGGTKGLVPAPAAGDAAAGKFLKADGTFAVPPTATGVSSIAGNTGAFTLGAGLTNSTNVLLADPVYHRGYIGGLTLSTAGSSATFGVSVGVAVDSASAGYMSLGSAYTKTTGSWAVGTANGSFDGTGTSPTTGTGWYHVFLIKRPDTGVVDILTSNSATSPTMPTNYTLFRRIGAMKADGANHWIGFTQIEEIFYWTTVVQDVNTSAQGTTAILYPLSVPTGVMVRPIFRILAPSSQGTTMLVTSPSETDVANPAGASGVPGFDETGATSQVFSAGCFIYTDTSAQIRIRSNLAAQTVYVNTRGWIDGRGRFD